MYTLDGCEFAYHLPIFVSEFAHSRRNWVLSLRDTIVGVVGGGGLGYVSFILITTLSEVTGMASRIRHPGPSPRHLELITMRMFFLLQWWKF